LQTIVEKYGLKCKQKDGLILLKYDQIESAKHKTNPAVKQARGIVLDEQFNIVSYGFERFFNLGETGAANINPSSAVVFFKEDGSLINVYTHDGQTIAATSGNIDAHDAKMILSDESFGQHFWQCFEDFKLNRAALQPKHTYMFELCGSFNGIRGGMANPQTKIVLLGARNLDTLEEFGPEELRILDKQICEGANVNSILCRLFDITLEEARQQVDKLALLEEGYVVVDYSQKTDGSFKRVKIKNPRWLVAHHEGEVTPPYVKIILDGEQDEFSAVLPKHVKYLQHCADMLNVLKPIVAEYCKQLENLYAQHKGDRKQIALALPSISKKPWHVKANSLVFQKAIGLIEHIKPEYLFLNHYNTLHKLEELMKEI
jgi:hypothetical protein